MRVAVTVRLAPVAFIVSAAGTTTVLAIYGLGQAEHPTGQFVGLLFGIVLSSIALLLGDLTMDSDRGLLLERVQWPSVTVLPIFWAVVALVPATRYSGRDTATRQPEEGVVVVDAAGLVAYLNDAAADVLDTDSADAVGAPVRSVIDEPVLDFETDDAIAVLERDDGRYAVRTSPLRGRHDRRMGQTVTIRAISGGLQREGQPACNRDGLERLHERNGLIRDVNRAVVSATTREEIERAVCEHLSDYARYETVCAADMPTWNGEADRWTVDAGDGSESYRPPSLFADNNWNWDRNGDGDGTIDGDEDWDGGCAGVEVEIGIDGEVDGIGQVDGESTPDPIAKVVDGTDGRTWTVVPLVYGRMVYGALGLLTHRDVIPLEERMVLAELGELIGHGINAIEHRRLLAAEAVVELEFRSTDDDAALVAVTQAIECRLELSGIVPGANGTAHAYIHVDGVGAERACDCLTTVTDPSATPAGRPVRAGENEGLVEWTLGGETLLGTLVHHGAYVLDAHAEDGTARIVVEAPADTTVRTLRDRVRQAYPDTRLAAKRERDRPVDSADSVPGDAIDALTDRQQEALEVAYRAGYYDWPRERTAEEVAATLDISAATLHAHLRKAERTLFGELFERGRRSHY